MRLKEYYLEDFMDLVKKLFGDKCEFTYNDNDGKYRCDHLQLYINSWNNKIHPYLSIDTDNVIKLMYLFSKCDSHWFEQPEFATEVKYDK